MCSRRTSTEFTVCQLKIDPVATGQFHVKTSLCLLQSTFGQWKGTWMTFVDNKMAQERICLKAASQIFAERKPPLLVLALHIEEC